jgi:glycosyltransferase involved in cell wall biosynthesis/ribosomal protein S18 acetylase RimI-like enzyme
VDAATRVRSAIKSLWFRLRGVDPEAVVVTFRSGAPDLCDRMEREFRELIPDRRHFVVRPGDRPDFRGLRIGMAAVLFDGDPAFDPLRRDAWRLAPTGILAYNRRLERHHLHWSTPIASLLFWRGVPLDRIWLRPRWWPFHRDRSAVPTTFQVLEGRPPSPTRAKVSILTPYFPWPLSHGGAVRLYNLIRENAREFDITLFSFIEEERDFEVILGLCAKLVLAPKPRYREPRWSTLAPPEVREYRSPTMARLIDEHRVGPMQVEYTQLAEYGGDILVEHDITFDLHRQVVERNPTWSARWGWWRWRRFERRALGRYRDVVVMSDKDAKLSGHPSPTVIANGVDLDRYRPWPDAPGRNLLFIGSFRHFPNIVAYRFLTEQVLERVADARLTVVAGPEPLLHWRAVVGTLAWPALPGVDLREFVADVRPLYEAATLVVVPTLESAGTNVKVLEAMAMGRAVVSTSSGSAGLGLEHGRDVWIADSAQDFAQGIERLLADSELRRGIGANARRTVEARFSWSGLARVQGALWHRLAPAPLSIRAARADEVGAWSAADCLVAELEGRVVGLLATRSPVTDEHEVLWLEVSAAARRCGIATILVSRWLAATRGDVYLEVRESNTAARALYASLGFQQVGRRADYYTDPTEPAIVMRRPRAS